MKFSQRETFIRYKTYCNLQSKILLGDRKVVHTMMKPGEALFIPKNFAYSTMNIESTLVLKEHFLSKGKTYSF